jgi:hypothetical protein
MDEAFWDATTSFVKSKAASIALEETSCELDFTKKKTTAAVAELRPQG